MKNYLIQLLDYELWANLRVINALDSVDNPPARAIAVMGHVLAAQHVWYGRIAHESVFVSIWEEIPVSWMIETAERQHRQVVSYVDGLTEEQLNQSISYVNSKGIPFQDRRLDMLTQMSHHAAYHRGQVVQLIRPMLSEAPVTDYIVWKRGG
ncbi:DinB family protein [Spirosoma validum]|uniref:Damage-inducible protein DinB n=1 Tax=Spirosoma validum TaxID=2771355 RepID=A0A927AX80_9BACT|nr:DinB family protein [Spirosoma validum]MBD2751443.1 damage-inducible protein DinB [Spirosoma validum]